MSRNGAGHPAAFSHISSQLIAANDQIAGSVNEGSVGSVTS